MKVHNYITSGMLRIVGERESVHAKLEAHITLRYVQCLSQMYKYVEKSPVQTTRRACSACQLKASTHLIRGFHWGILGVVSGCTGIMTYTLVELPVSSQGHSGLISSVDSVNVIAFDGLNLIHSYIACKWYLIWVLRYTHTHTHTCS